MEETTDLIKIEPKSMAVMKKIAEIMKQKATLADQEKEAKDLLQKLMEKHNVNSVDNEYLKITYVKESSSTNIDLDAVKKKEPTLYSDLLKDYPKTSTRSATIRIAVK